MSSVNLSACSGCSSLSHLQVIIVFRIRMKYCWLKKQQKKTVQERTSKSNYTFYKCSNPCKTSKMINNTFANKIKNTAELTDKLLVKMFRNKLYRFVPATARTR